MSCGLAGKQWRNKAVTIALQAHDNPAVSDRYIRDNSAVTGVLKSWFLRRMRTLSIAIEVIGVNGRRLKLGLLLMVIAILTGSSHAQTSAKRIEITAKRFEFTPAEITLKVGQPVVIVLQSADVAHGLRFRELNLNIKVDKGKTSEAAFTPTKTGTFTGQCSVFCGSGHGHMKLTLHVVN